MRPCVLNGSSSRKRRILVVDDEPAVLTSLAGILGAAGYEVDLATTLAEGRRALGERPYDLVVTDLYLDEPDLGYALADAARQCRPPIPVVLMTGRPSFDRAREAMRSEIVEIIVKPTGDRELIDVCGRAIRDVELRRHNAKLEAQTRLMAQVLPRTIEIKDPTTHGHADRVVRYADALATRCKVSAEDREALAMASLLHDIGKIGVDRNILCKEGPLTAEERQVIQTHPQMGFDILEPLEDCDRVREWVYQHHERWDGRGYPNGLAGEEVALPGRILILAEVYDALAEARSYKTAWENSRIVEFFRAEAGRHFDPELARLVADGLDREGRRFLAPPGRLF
jgi:putative two-component system response regulator